MNKDGIRIEKIKSDHAELLKMVRASIEENKDHLSESIDSVITVLDFDDKTIKRYEATVNAQELIVSLTQEILNATSKEEIIEIRKKLNYYINKIKAEIKRRNLDDSYLNDYQEKASYLRKDIAKYIRFLKREDNIQEMDRLYSNYENLTEDEMIALKKALKREVNYNRRNLVPSVEKKENVSHVIDKVDVDSSATEGVKNIDSVDTVLEEESKSDGENNNEEDEFTVLEEDFDEPVREENEDLFGSDEVTPEKSDLSEQERFDLTALFEYRDSVDEADSSQDTRLQITKVLGSSTPVTPYFMKNISQTEFSEVKEFFDKKVQQYNHQYDVVPTLDYSRRHKARNFVHFFRNIPRYIHNKNAIRHMIFDYCRFYHGNDLGSYIEYMKQRNSIRGGLKSLFSKAHLYDNSDLNRHAKCSKWLYDFCRNNELDLTFQTDKSI